MRATSILALGLIGLVALAAVVQACPSPRDNPNNKYKASGDVKVFAAADKQFTVKQGQEFAIRLDSNPTTGYTWMLKNDAVPNGLELIGCRYKRAAVLAGEKPLIGSGGADTWGFRATTSGPLTIELQKVRPWVKPRPEVMDATFTVTVQ